MVSYDSQLTITTVEMLVLKMSLKKFAKNVDFYKLNITYNLYLKLTFVVTAGNMYM